MNAKVMTAIDVKKHLLSQLTDERLAICMMNARIGKAYIGSCVGTLHDAHFYELRDEMLARFESLRGTIDKLNKYIELKEKS